MLLSPSCAFVAGCSLPLSRCFFPEACACVSTASLGRKRHPLEKEARYPFPSSCVRKLHREQQRKRREDQIRRCFHFARRKRFSTDAREQGKVTVCVREKRKRREEAAAVFQRKEGGRRESVITPCKTRATRLAIEQQQQQQQQQQEVEGSQDPLDPRREDISRTESISTLVTRTARQLHDPRRFEASISFSLVCLKGTKEGCRGGKAQTASRKRFANPRLRSAPMNQAAGFDCSHGSDSSIEP